jgi:hypothetical protein
MQILHRFAGSIQRYSEELSDPDRYRPDHCPQCEAHQLPPSTDSEVSADAKRITRTMWIIFVLLPMLCGIVYVILSK